MNFSRTRGIFLIKISIHSNRLSSQIYRQKTDLKVLNIFSIKTYQIFPAGKNRKYYSILILKKPAVCVRLNFCPILLLHVNDMCTYFLRNGRTAGSIAAAAVTLVSGRTRFQRRSFSDYVSRVHTRRNQ